VSLKWPNDVLVGGKKISGILLEVAGDALIVGIGLNIAHHPDTALYPATSLYQEIANHERDRIPSPSWGGLGRGFHGASGEPLHNEQTLQFVLNHLLDHLAHWHDRMQAEGFAPIRAAWLRDAQQGRLTVRLPKETLQGSFAGIDESGALRLVLDDGAERSISTGDVVLPPKD
jgi:BirA family biotin operon repressor/biotin-[acetyl-CoA-carboxylase] ligase